MYPTINLVECPRCGSCRKQALGPDRYRCSDCGMHYHLDWADGYVQVRQPTAPRPSPAARLNWLPFKVLLVVAVAMLVLIGVSFWAAGE
jgi:DNA-directed RNA polymerase subunit RPC12/RpoP